MTPNESAGVVVPDHAGETITDLERREAIILAAREDVTTTWFRISPGERGPKPHVHREHTDSFYVLEGELTFVIGPDREPVTLPAGGFGAAPPGFVHTYENRSDADVRFLNFHTPDGGFAAYMRGRRDGDENASFDSFEPQDDWTLPLSEGILRRPGEGERLVRGNRVLTLKADLPDLFFAEFEIDGRLGGPDPHSHDDQVDSFYVLEGELELTVDGDRHRAGPGTLASVPRNVVHTFAHPGTGKVRFLNIHAPDRGFGDYMRRVSSG